MCRQVSLRWTEKKCSSRALERLIGDSAYDLLPPVQPKNPYPGWPRSPLFLLFLVQNHRRLTIRWEYQPDNFFGMLHRACAIILIMYL